MSKGIEIPSSWLQVGLSDLFLDPKNNIVDGPFGSNLKASEYKEEGIPIIRIQNIDRNKFIDKNINYVTEEKAEFLSRHSFQSGDIIITKLGTPVGKACFVPKIFERGIIVADLIRVRIDNDNINEKFLVYQINSSFLIKQFEKYTKGTTRPRINLSIVRELKFNLPPIKEQQRIVSVMEELFSDLDNGVANLKLAQNQLKIYRQALLKHAFEGKLTEKWRKDNNPEPAEKLLESIKKERKKHYELELSDWKEAIRLWQENGKTGKKPKKPTRLLEIKSLTREEISKCPEVPTYDWKWVKLGNITNKITDGEHFRPQTQNDGVYFISAKDVLKSGVSFENPLYISEETATKSRERCDPEKGDILIVSRGATVGRSCYIDTEQIFCLLGSVILIKPVKYIKGKFLNYFISSTYCQQLLIGMSGATAQQAIYLRDIQHIPIPLMSNEEQEALISNLENKFSIIDNLEQAINSGLLKSEVLRYSILNKAFEGTLVEQDLNEEPATELLKRIRAEKKKYIEKQKLEVKKAPQKIKKMNKELSIEDVLKTSNEPMLSADVWLQSKHKDNIEDFYTELKNLQKTVKELKKGNQSLLTLEK